MTAAGMEAREKAEIRGSEGMREKAERAVATHPTKCPAANSIRGCIDLDISAEISEE